MSRHTRQILCPNFLTFWNVFKSKFKNREHMLPCAKTAFQFWIWRWMQWDLSGSLCVFLGDESGGDVLNADDWLNIECRDIRVKFCVQIFWRFEMYLNQNLKIGSICSHVPKQHSSSFFMKIIVLAVWAIWKTRNSFIFQNITPSLYRTKAFFSRRNWNGSNTQLQGSPIIPSPLGQITSCSFL
jgi:hypothetical protein